MIDPVPPILRSGTRLLDGLCRLALAFCMAFALAACDHSPIPDIARAIKVFKKHAAAPRLPDPVERKDGLAYIPIDDTAFLIPEKTWLKGYARHSTDGLVASITLHATIPDVQPWSQARHEEMYWSAGPGKTLEIRIYGDRASQVRNFPDVPRSIRQRSDFIEEPSDQAAQGLRRFRELWTYKLEPAELEKHRKEFGDEQVNRLLAKDGTPDLSTTYYEFIEHDRVKYLVDCSDSKDGLFQGCHLMFPLARTLMVDVTFVRDHIRDIVAMADKLNERLHEFEAAGLARRAAHPPIRITLSPSISERKNHHGYAEHYR